MSPAAQRAYDAITKNAKAQTKLKSAIKNADDHEQDSPRGSAFEEVRTGLNEAAFDQINTDLAEAQAISAYIENYAK
jgi:hypothetical protein